MAFMILMAGLSSPLGAAEEPCSIQNVLPQDKIFGCNFIADQTYVFITRDNDFNRALINIGGTTRELKLIKGINIPDHEKIGDEYSRIYAADDIKVRVDYKLTYEGEESELGSCEYSLYDSTLTVSYNGQTCTIKTQGKCGC
jgi:hypothetical protein